MGLVHSSHARNGQSCKSEHMNQNQGHDRAHQGTTCLQRDAISALNQRLECEARRVELAANLPPAPGS